MTRSPPTPLALLRGLAACWLLLVQSVAAAPDYFGTGDAHHGVLTVNPGEDLIVNDYTGLAAAVPADGSRVVVDDSSAFTAGDLILLWQAAGLPDPGAAEQMSVDLAMSDVGRYEFARVRSVDSGAQALDLETPTNAAFFAASTQVVRVPEYASVNVTATGRVRAKPWDGDTGGIVVFLVSGVLHNDGQISASGAGFRGGTARGNSGANGCAELNLPSNPSNSDRDRAAQKGEGIVSSRYGDDHRARTNVVNGGGGGVCHNSGGGGGGHAGSGGQGGRTWRDDNDGVNTTYGRDVGGLGGAALTYDPLLRMTMGGGGGAGQMNNGLAGRGRAGGGIVLLRAGSTSGTGSFSASGVDGENSFEPYNDSAGAAGAGGSVVMQTVVGLACGNVTANGGVGGSAAYDDHGPGGGGGGGYVRLSGASISCTPSAIGGVAGTQTNLANALGPSYGATDGSAGSVESLTVALVIDQDADGHLDVAEGASDTDGDGIPDFVDHDDDNDGVPSSVEGALDSDGDGVADHLDLDSDADGVPDVSEIGLTADGAGRVAGLMDANADGLHDTAPSSLPDTDADGTPDHLDVDSDGDGIDDRDEAFDSDGDGDADSPPLDADHDGDGIDDRYDADCPMAAGCSGGGSAVDMANLTPSQDSDANGVPDWLQTCADGYVTSGEACDDGDADDGNACSNACRLGAGQDCATDADCATAVCEGDVCQACRDDISGGTDSGCNVGAPICRGDAGALRCSACADSEPGTELDEGCSAGAPSCDESAMGDLGACTGCTENSECEDGDPCTTNTCAAGTCEGAPLGVGQACLDGNGVCDQDAECVACLSNADCASPTPVCDDTSAEPSCVACVSDSDCDDERDCTADVCEGQSCESTPVAPGTTCLNGAGACDGAGSCVAACETDGDCDDANDCTLDRCGDDGCEHVNAGCEDGDTCTQDADCRSQTPICLTSGGAGRCVSCTRDADCGSGVCDALNSCKDCVDDQAGSDLDTGCSALRPRCDESAATSICVECFEDDDCSDDQQCASDGGCAARCEGDGDCSGTDRRRCDAELEHCVQCLSDADCTAVARCDSGLCVARDSDGDGVTDELDPDDDDDGVLDADELRGVDLSTDRDLDGIADFVDADLLGCADQDADGRCDRLPQSVDADLDGVANHLDLDSDGDGLPDLWENGGRALDADADGLPDASRDDDGDGLLAAFDDDDSDARVRTSRAVTNSDESGPPDHLDLDADGDGIADVVEANGDDLDGNGLADGVDGNGNGVVSTLDPSEGGQPLSPPDTDADGVFDFQDTDTDADGFVDALEGFDVNADGFSDLPASGRDADLDGWDDAHDPPSGTLAPLPDMDGDGVPDYRDADDDGDGIPTREQADQDPRGAADTDGDGIPDYRDPSVEAPAPDEQGSTLEAGVSTPAPGEDAEEPREADPGLDAGERDEGAPAPIQHDEDAGSSGDSGVAPSPNAGHTAGLAGGAGCKAAPGSTSWWGLALLGVAWLVWRRRSAALLAVAAVSTSSITTQRIALAQEAGFNLSRFRPSETSADLFQTSRPNDLGAGVIDARVLFDYSNDPLVLEAEQGDASSEGAAIVAHHLIAHAGISYGLLQRVVVFGNVPVSLLMTGEQTPAPAVSANPLPGDPTLGARVRVYGENDELVSFALQAALTLPLARWIDEQQAYAGDSTFTALPEFVLELRPGLVRVAANAGARLKRAVPTLSTSVGSELTYCLGASTSPFDGAELMAELYGSSAFAQMFSRDGSPIELLLGGKLLVSSGFTLGMAVGPGLTRGIGSPDFRAVGVAGWTSD